MSTVLRQGLSMLKVVHGNRLEPLAGELMRSLLEVPASPFEVETVVVPSLGVARWLQYRVADVFGVCMQIEFAFAAQFVWQTFARLLDGVPRRSPFDVQVMTLRLYAQLGRLPASEVYAPLRRYIEQAGEQGRIQLAEKLAQVFDRYLVYRPEWVQSWAAGQLCGLTPSSTERWQLGLWRRLVEDAGLRDLQHPAEIVAARLRDDVAARRQLPRRIRLFALPTLPPQYVRAVADMAQYTDVECYVLNPCRQYWGDLMSERASARMALRDAASSASGIEVAHPLLASWGTQARDHLAEVLQQTDTATATEQPMFVDPGTSTLLHRLQRSLLELGPLAMPPLAAAQLHEPVRSLQVHACHSLTRQLEVLHDQLLTLFDQLPGLRPQDVLVMMPDVDEAAPLIDAVFGAATAEHRIGYSITGRAAADSTPLLSAFDTLLKLPASRFAADEVFDHLQVPAVRERYGLGVSELDSIRQWIGESGVRWGLDAAHRSTFDLPSEARHSWVDGLMRLLLGYAAPSDRVDLVAGLQVYEDIEGTQTAIAGKLLRALGDLVRLRDDLRQMRSVAGWCDRLSRMLEEQLSPTTDDESDAHRLRQVIAQLRDDADAAGHRDAVPLDVVRQLIASQLAGSSPGGVPGGALTFTGIGPLRGLPYRVIAVIGLDGGRFPRNPAVSEFDLLGRHPRRGDRSRGQDDRGAFLDALLAARDVFYVSYTGRSIRTNQVMPPSVLVAELLDQLARDVEGGRPAVDAALLTEHPLQPFSPRYFVPGPLHSHARDFRDAARCIVSAQRPPPVSDVLDGQRLPVSDELARQLTLDRLTGCLRNPYRFFLRDRLGIRIDPGEQQLASEEPLALPDPRWDFERELLELAMDGHDERTIHQRFRAGIALPHGGWGDHLLSSAVRPVIEFAEQVRAERAAALPALPFELRIGHYTLSGVIDQLTADGLYLPRYTHKLSAHDWLHAWPRHLLLCVLRPDGIQPRCLVRGCGDQRLEWAEVPDAESHMLTLLDTYQDGLQAPLPYLPKTALQFADEPDRPDKAEKIWAPGYNSDGESADAYCRLFYRGQRTTLPDGLPALARRIFGPMIAAARDRP